MAETAPATAPMSAIGTLATCRERERLKKGIKLKVFDEEKS
jgi:hypothetical protein